MVFKKHSKLKAYSLQLKANILLLAIVFSLGISTLCHAEFYRYNIDELARKAKVRIKEIEQKIEEEKLARELQSMLAEVTSLYNKAESLFAERRYEEAITVYRQIDRMSRSSEAQRLFSK